MTPEQLRAYYQQHRQQMPVRPIQQPTAQQPRPMTPLPKNSPVQNVKPYVQPRTSGGCCGRRWQG